MRFILRPALSARSAVGTAEARLVHRPWRPSPRLVGLAILTVAVAALLAYMVVNVPLVAPRLSRAEAVSHWGAAMTGALIVLAYGLVVVSAALRASRRSSRQLGDAAPATAPHPATDRARLIPRSLSLEHVSKRAAATSAFVSTACLTVAAIGGYPLWVAGLAVVIPWLPLVTVEASWKYERHGVFAAFALLVLLQVVHMGEHTMQVGQLLASQGDLATSHGVFGQLDFELVHFVTDTALWLTLGLLLLGFYSGNRWLWVAFAAASLHQVEHFYLFWLNNFHGSLYEQGGFAGIMGDGGMIGSPLDRPYLHFAYNFIVVVPLVIALWDQARRVDGRAAAR